MKYFLNKPILEVIKIKIIIWEGIDLLVYVMINIGDRVG